MSNPIEIIRNLVIPDDADVHPRYLMASFFIKTPHGDAKVKAGGRSIEISGTPAVIFWLGLAKEEWLPGFPGNNYTAQTVAFIGDRIELPHGKNRKGKRPPMESRIIIRKWGHEVPVVTVEAAISYDQEEKVWELLRRPTKDSRQFTGYTRDGNVITLRAK